MTCGWRRGRDDRAAWRPRHRRARQTGAGGPEGLVGEVRTFNLRVHELCSRSNVDRKPGLAGVNRPLSGVFRPGRPGKMARMLVRGVLRPRQESSLRPSALEPADHAPADRPRPSHRLPRTPFGSACSLRHLRGAAITGWRVRSPVRGCASSPRSAPRVRPRSSRAPGRDQNGVLAGGAGCDRLSADSKVASDVGDLAAAVDQIQHPAANSAG